MKGIGGILGGIWALRPDLNLLRRNKENYEEVEGDHRLEIIRGGVEEFRHWILPYMLDASLNVGFGASGDISARILRKSSSLRFMKFSEVL